MLPYVVPPKYIHICGCTVIKCGTDLELGLNKASGLLTEERVDLGWEQVDCNAGSNLQVRLPECLLT